MNSIVRKGAFAPPAAPKSADELLREFTGGLSYRALEQRIAFDAAAVATAAAATEPAAPAGEQHSSSEASTPYSAPEPTEDVSPDSTATADEASSEQPVSSDNTNATATASATAETTDDSAGGATGDTQSELGDSEQSDATVANAEADASSDSMEAADGDDQAVETSEDSVAAAAASDNGVDAEDAGADAPGAHKTSLVFIDQNVDKLSELIAGAPSDVEVVLLSSDRSGLEQIAERVATTSNLGSIHIISHGEAGRLFLGSDVVDLGTVTGEHRDQLAAIGSSLAIDGDILLYGCDVGAGVAGQEFVDALADITGADIAASDDDTGALDLGGDWVLERQVGLVDTDPLSVDAYSGILAQNNTGAWTVAGATATNTTSGVTTTVTFGSFSNGTTNVNALANNNLSNLAIFSPTVQNTGSLEFAYNWDTSPEGATTEASNDAGTVVVTITFSQAVTNPILHLDRIGGSDGAVQNGARWTLLTSGVSLTRLAGTTHFAVDSGAGTIQSSAVDQAIGGGYSGETSTTTNQGTAGGSVQLTGTFTTVSFLLSAAPNSNEGAGADAMELKLTFDPAPVASNDSFSTPHDTPITIDVRSNDTDVNNDALTVVRVNSITVTAGGPGVAVTGGVVTLNAGGNLVYTPDAEYAGSTSFNYTVSDANGGSSSATVTGTIVNYAPVLDLNSTPTPSTTTNSSTSTATTNLVVNGAFSDNAANPANWTESGTDQGTGANGRYIWVDGPGAISQTLAVPANTTSNTVDTVRTATSTTVTTTTVATTNVVTSIAFDLAYQNADVLLDNDNRLTVSYNGVVYATFETAEGGAAAANGTWTYSNGASGPVATTAGVASEATGATSAITINLPTGVTASGPLLLSYGNGSTGDGSDDVAIDNVTVTNTAITTTTVQTTTTTADTASTGFAATYTENGAAVSIADTDASVFDSDDSQMVSATVTLTNGSTGDQLLVSGSAAASGTIGAISWTRTNSLVTFSGAATTSQYAAAIQAVQFQNTTDTPAAGARIINVVVNDGNVNSNTAVATISVDRLPDLVNDSVSGNEDTAISGNVLANDDVGDTPITSVTVATGPANGTLTSFNTTTGAFTYTPNANFNGADSFTYTVTDADGDARTATVSISIAPVNDAPTQIVPAAQTTAEDTNRTITGISVADVDGGALTTTLSIPAGTGAINVTTGGGATITGNGSGTVTVVGTAAQINAAVGSITYVPTADYNGSATLSISTTDGAATASNTVGITVTAVADITNDSITTNEDTAITANVITGTNGASADNFENAGRTLTSVTQGANGAVTFTAAGAVTYTPNANFNGTDTFTYTVTSGGVTETATVTVTVNSVNDAPTQVVPGAQTTAEDTNRTITGISVADVDGGALTTTLTLPAGAGAINVTTGGGAAISGNGTNSVTVTGTAAQINAAVGSITYVPTADYNGSTSLSISTTDGTATASNSVAISVTAVADITNDSITTNEDTAVTANVITGTNGATADTFENAGRVVTSVTQGANGTVTFLANGSISYTPNANFNGSDSFTYTVTSGGVTETATVTVTVSAVNDAPTQTLPGSQTIAEDGSVVFSAANGNAITVADVDGNLTTTLSVANGTLTLGSIAGVTVTGNGTGSVTVSGAPSDINSALAGLTFAPVADFNGAASLSVSTSDGVAPAVAGSVAITITAVADIVANSATTAEDTAVTLNVLTNDSFANAGRVVTSVTQPPNGAVTFLANGQVTYTPNANYHGAETFSYTVTSGGVTETTTVSITVTPVNDAPTAAALVNQTSVDGEADSYNAGAAFADVDGDALTYSATGLPLGLSINTTTGAITGTLNGHASQGGASGVYSVTVTAIDGNGGSVSRLFTWTVTNPAPNAVADSFTTEEDTALSGNVLANDSDPDGDALTVNTTPVTGPANGVLVLNADGSFTYTPNLDYTGLDSFTYQVTDADGGSNTATVSITVTAENDGPVLTAPGAQTTAEDQNIIFSSANGNAIAVSDPDTASIQTTVSALHGTITLGSTAGVTVSGNGTGAVTITGSPAAITSALNGLVYASNADYFGADTLTISSTDGIETATASVGLTITPVADIVADSVATNEDAAISFNVLTGANGASADNFEGAASVTAFTQPANGAVTISAAGAVVYTPNANFNGVDTFTYTVTSGGVTETAVVTVTVAPVNDAPVQTLPAGQTANEDADIVFSGANGNQIIISDVDAALVSTTLSVPVGTLTLGSTAGVTITGGANGSGSVTISGAPSAVTAALNGLRYTPVADFNGATSIFVATSDGVAAPASGSIGVTITPVADIANDSATTNEDTAATISVLANDTFENAGRSVTAVTQGANGSVVINGDGTLTYTPNANFNGVDSFTYTVTSGGVTETATVSVTVDAVNDTPTQTFPGPQSAAEDTLIVFSAANGNAISVADIDGGPLTTTVAVTNGVLTLGSTAGVTISGNGTGSVTISGSAVAINTALNGLVYQPTADYNGAALLTVSTTDGAATANASVALTVTPVADIVADSISTNEDTALSFNVLSNDTFEGAGAVVSAVTQGANGSVTIGAGGVVTYTPNANYNGSDSFTYTVSSGGVTETATVTVTVASINDAPTLAAPAAQSTNEDAPIVFSNGNGNAIVVADADATPLTLTLSAANGLLTLASTAGVTVTGDGTASVTVSGSAAAINAAVNGLRFAPNADYNGSAGLTVSVTDGALSATQNVAITINPVVDIVADSIATNEDTAVTFNVLTNDTFESAGRAVTSATQGASGTVSFLANGTIVYTPDANFHGSDSFTYTVTSGGVTETTTVTVLIASVNDAPTTAGLANRSDLDGQSVTLNVSGAFADADGDALTYAISGLPPGLSYNPATGVISGAIDIHASQGAPYTVTVTATDGNGGSTVASFTWSVANPAPTANNDSASIAEDSSATIAVLANDVDPDGDALVVTSATAGNGVVAINGDGTITYTPAANFHGVDTIAYQISDGDGGFATATVTVTVTPVNDAPVVAGASITTAEDTAISGSLPVATDADGDALTYSLATGAANGAVTVAANGAYTYTPNANFNGPDSFTFTVSDGNGGTVTRTVTVNVTPVNDAPVVAATSITTAEDTAISGSLPVATDADGDALTYSLATGAANGVVTVAANGAYAYTPNANFNGSDSFTFTVSDGNGGTITRTVTVTVTPVNDAPTTAGLPNLSDNDGEAISISVAPAFADADGNALTYTVSGLPPGLSLNPTTGAITGAIDSGASGPAGDQSYPITVTADDGQGGTVSTTFTWRVLNLAPSALDDSVSTPEDTAVVAQVLANDADPDGDSLTITAVNGQPITVGGASVTTANGSVELTIDGFGQLVLVFTPDSNFNGVETITYTIADGNNGIDTATLTVTVTPVNDAPVVAGASITTAEDTAISGSLPVAMDADGNSLTYSLATGATNGTVTVAANGAYTYTPNANFFGSDSFTFTVSDGNGGTVTETVAITVTPVNDIPVVAGTSITTPEDMAISGALPVATDADGDPLTYSLATGAANGSVTVAANGVYTYTPNANFNGSDSFTFRVSDGNGGIVTRTVVVTVTPVNDAPTSMAIANRASNDSDAVTFNAGAFFNDVDATGGDTLTYSATGLPPGLTINAATGAITGTIDSSASQTGPYTVVVTATDSASAASSQSFNWTVLNPAPTAMNDALNTGEGIDVSINAASGVLDNDMDPDGDALVVSEVAGSALNVGAPIAGSAGGTFTINGDGSYTFAQNGAFDDLQDGESRQTSVTYTIADGDGGVSTATLTVTVGGGNNVPSANPIAAQSSIDSAAFSLNVAAAFNDADGDTLTYSASGLPAGLSINATSGVISGTLASSASQGGAAGVYSVTVTADDGNGGVTPVTFSLTITNPSPIAADDAAAVSEDVPASGNVLVNDNDPDGDVLSVASYTVAGLGATFAAGDTAVIPGVGSFTLAANGDYTFAPAPDYTGAVPLITYTMTDADGGTDVATLTLGPVSAVNDAPASTPVAAQSGADGGTVTFDVSGNFSDVDGDALAYSATGLPPGLAINPATGEITGTFDNLASAGSPYTVVVTATDGGGLSSSQTFTWAVTNPAPTGGVIANATGVDAQSVAIAAGTAFSDPDGDTLSYSASGLPAGLLINPATGSISGTLTRDASVGGPSFNGVYTISVTATDSQGASVTRSFTFTASNPAPTAGADNFTGAEDTPISGSVAGNDSDPDGDALTFSLVTPPAQGVVVFNSDGSFTYTPAANYNGPASFTYRVTDANGATTTALVSITITPVNDAPVVAGASITTAEDTAISGSLPVATDVDGDALTYSLATGAANGVVTVAANGAYTYTPNANFNGSDSFTFTVSDGNGGTVTRTVTVNVTPVNDAPVVAGASITTAEDTAISGSLPVASDVDGNPLTYSVGAQPANGTVTIAANGVYTYTPAANYFGADSFTFTVSDGNGGTVTRTVTVNVTPVNDAPVAANGSFSTVVDAPRAGSLPAATDADGDLLTYSLTTGATNGVVTVAADGTYIYTPNSGYIGPDSFTFTVSDGNGGTVTRTMSITVTPLNSAPVAVDDGFTGAEDTILTGDVTPGTLGQDSDVDGDPVTVVDADGNAANGITPVSGPSHGVLTLQADGTFSYTPNANYSGVDSFTYRITDGRGEFSEADVTLTITPVNDPPVTQNSSFTTPEDQSYSGVLSAASDPEGSAITYGLGSVAPSHGVVSISASGAYVYTPDANYNGADRFTYIVSDGTSTVERTVTIIVTPVNDAPVVSTPAPVTSNDGDTISLGLSPFAVDIDGDRLTYSASGLPPGLSIDPATGRITGTLPSNASQGGPYAVTFTVVDAAGKTASASFNWTVNNPPPVAQSDAAAVAANGNVTVSVLGNDSDPDGDTPLSVTGASAGSGSVVVLADGSIRYTPAAGFSGNDVVTYTISDGQGGFSTATVSISVAAAVFGDVYDEKPPVFGFNGLDPFKEGFDVVTTNLEGISVDGAVLDAVFDIQSLNSLAVQLYGDGVVIAAANGVSSLNGIGSVGEKGIVIDTVRAERAREIAFRAGFDRNFQDYRLEGLTGFSLRHNVPGNLGGLSEREQIVIDTLVREKTLALQISNTLERGAKRIVEYRISQADGKPLPQWLHRAASDLLIGQRDVNVETIDLRIEAVYSDGTTIVEGIRVDTATGEIQSLKLDAPSVASPLFKDQFRAKPMLSGEQVRDLGRALSR